MMSWKSLGRLLSGIKGAYNDINPATLTGAIDVIVVEQQDGSFTCGPFHVRFGKLTAISPADKTVEIYVNGEFVDFLRMCLGSDGDAYFVDSSGSVTDEFLPSDTVGCPGFTYDDTWSGLSMRRHPRKVRRDSAMSEPGTESKLIEENIDELNDYEVSSDCETLDESLKDSLRCRNSMGNSFVSDSQLDESSKVAVREYSWNWGSEDLKNCQSVNSSDISNTDRSVVRDDGTMQANDTCGKGLYLEELVTEQDQNIKEAYIYPPSHVNPSSHSQSYGSIHATDSGYADYGYRSDNEHTPRSISPVSPQVASLRLSLCGGLSPDKPCSEEKFLEHIVSYEEFIREPNSILSNPNLVVYFNGRYWNWQIAAPSIVSVLAFQTQLPYLTLQRLESQYLPKKQSRRTSWFSWGTSYTQTVTAAPEPVIPSKKEEDKPQSSNCSCSEPTLADLLDNFSAESCFEQAAAYVPRIVNSLDSSVLLYLYARYKQATAGPCNVPKPGIFDINGRKKWSAWHDLGNMSTEEAQKQYVEKLHEVDPTWKPSDTKQRSVYVSRMINLDPNSNDPPMTSNSDESIFNLIKENDIEGVNSLLSSKSDEVHATDKNGMTPLHWASDRGYCDLVSILLKHNAIVNVKDTEGQTPLHYACSCGHDEVIKVLLKYGADIHAKDNEENSACDLYEGDFQALFNDQINSSAHL
uniref:Acyl-CoA-binding domain-containing protein 6 n=1 Tax=Trichobilharzia regenti TaxID=157069 RepID=A0AA85JQT7_TRIRE|nr:unnamed protein product [Trichobilharzia regenti]